MNLTKIGKRDWWRLRDAVEGRDPLGHNPWHEIIGGPLNLIRLGTSVKIGRKVFGPGDYTPKRPQQARPIPADWRPE